MKRMAVLSFFISLAVNTVSIAAELCSAPTIENIIPGVYQTQNGFCYLVEGPTPSADRFVYTFRGYNSFTGCNSGIDKFTALITTGSASDHPDIGDREVVPSLQASYIYGFVTGGGSFDIVTPIDSSWNQNELLGVRQSGDQLIIGLFSDGLPGNIIDFTTPLETALLTKISEATCREADPNRDGETNILDVITLIDFVLGN